MARKKVKAGKQNNQKQNQQKQNQPKQRADLPPSKNAPKTVQKAAPTSPKATAIGTPKSTVAKTVQKSEKGATPEKRNAVGAALAMPKESKKGDKGQKPKQGSGIGAPGWFGNDGRKGDSKGGKRDDGKGDENKNGGGGGGQGKGNDGKGGDGKGGGGGKKKLGDNQKSTTVQKTGAQKKLQGWGMDAARKYANTKLTPGPKTVTPFNEQQKLGQSMALKAAGTQNALASTGAQTVQDILKGGGATPGSGSSVLTPPTVGSPYGGQGNPGGSGIAPQPRPINTPLPSTGPTGVPPSGGSGVGKSLAMGPAGATGGNGMDDGAAGRAANRSTGMPMKKSPMPGATSGQIMPGAAGGEVGNTGMVTPGVAAFNDPKAATGNFLTSGAAMNPATNPFLKSSIDAATRPMLDRLREDILPSIRGEAVTSGNFGSSRQGIAEGLAASRANRDMADIAAGMSNENYGRGLDAMGKAYGENLGAATSAYGTKEGAVSDRFGTQEGNLSNRFATTEGNTTQRYGIQQDATTAEAGQKANMMQGALNALPTIQGAQNTGAITTSGVGDVRQGQDERALQEEQARHLYKQNVPFDKASNLLSLMPALPGGTTVSTGPTPTTNPFASALGGAGMGATIGSAIPGVGTAVGAGVGALAGGVSSLYDKIFK